MKNNTINLVPSGHEVGIVTMVSGEILASQDDRQDHRSHAGYGRGYVDAGPADPFQAETYDGF